VRQLRQGYKSFGGNVIDIPRLLDMIDLRELAEEAGAQIRMAGREEGSSPCPLHGGDNESAFHIYRSRDGRWRWHCFTNCPEGENGGDAISFYQRWRGVDFKVAVAELGERAGVDVVKQRPSQQRFSPAPSESEGPSEKWLARAKAFTSWAHEKLIEHAGALSYVREERGLTDETLVTWQVGYNPKDLYDDPERWGLEGRKIWLSKGITIPGPSYVKIRRPQPGDLLSQRIGAVEYKPGIKYGSPRGGRKGIFGLDHAGGNQVLMLVEGEFDCLLAWQECRDLVDVATLGGARHRLASDDALQLLRYRRIIAVYDEDAAGDDGRAYLSGLSERIRAVAPPAHDLTDYWVAGGAMWLRNWVEEVAR
jgi:DNA primase